MNCTTCSKDLEFDVDFDGMRSIERIVGGQRCDNCLDPTCAACIDGGWCPECVAREEKIAAYPSLGVAVPR